MTNEAKRTELLLNIRGAALLANKPALATAVSTALEAEKEARQEANRMQWVNNVLSGAPLRQGIILA